MDTSSPPPRPFRLRHLLPNSNPSALSPSFQMSSGPRHWTRHEPPRSRLTRHNRRLAYRWRRFWFHTCFFTALILLILGLSNSFHGRNREQLTGQSDYVVSNHNILRPANSARQTAAEDPEKWLTDNSDNAHAFGAERSWSTLLKRHQWSAKPKAAIISLVRNEELDGIMQSMRQLEYHWNHKYRYPWIFFNEKHFSEEFKVSMKLS